MTEKFRALEKLANDPRTPPHEAAAARRILERLKKEAAANGNAGSKHDAKPPPDPRRTVYFYVPGGGVFMIGADQVAELKAIHPQGRVLTEAEANRWFEESYRSKPRAKKKAAPRPAKKTSAAPRPRKKAASSKVRDGKRKPPPKTRAEKQIGFIDNVLQRGSAVQVAVATNDKVVGTWAAKGVAQIRAVLKKALAQAHLLAQRGYPTCIAVVYPDGSKTVQCWPE